MLYFPQLVSGATGQFPGTKRVLRRTVVNEAVDGSTVKLADPTASAREWRLALAGLTDAEWNAIETLFEAVEGRLGCFTFLDPFDNLLSWSEDASAAAWIKEAGLAVTGGIADPLGGTGAAQIANQGASAASIRQSVSGPGWYRYCLSVWARSAAPASITLFQSIQSKSASQEFAIGPAWVRLEYSASLAGSEEAVEFGATIAAGGVVELFGFQAEAQMGASKYKKTTGRSGVHANASFLDDTLTRTGDGVEDNSCQLLIRASG